jgi:hypothetical protein
MVLFRQQAKRTVCECVAWLQALREGRWGTDSLSKEYRSLKYFVSLEKSSLGKTGRRGVCRLVHKGRIVGRSSTFENPPKGKQAGLKVRSGGRAIRCVAVRCKGYMGMKLRNQGVQIGLRFDCRWIGQPVERCPNNQQTQQTCRDLGSHSFVALCIYPSGTSFAYGHWPRQQRHPLFLRCNKLYGR